MSPHPNQSLFRAAWLLAALALGCARPASYRIASTPKDAAATAVLVPPDVPLWHVRINGEPLAGGPSGAAPSMWRKDQYENAANVPAGEVTLEGEFRYTCRLLIRSLGRSGINAANPYDYEPLSEKLSISFSAQPGHRYRVDVLNNFRRIEHPGSRRMDSARWELESRGGTPPPNITDRYDPIPIVDGYVNLSHDCPDMLRLRVTDLTENKVVIEGGR